MNKPSLEILTAYVDGELDDIRRREVDEAIRSDEALAETVEQLRASRIMLSKAFADVIDAPIPARITRAIGSSISSENVIRLQTTKGTSRQWAPLSLAASVSLIVGALVGFVVADNSPSNAPATTANLLQDVLDRLPTGSALTSSDSHTVATVLSSFRILDGRICREFEQRAEAQQSIGIACRGPETAGWETLIQVTTARGLSDARPGESYAPANGGLDPLEWVFERLGAAPALDSAEEAELIARKWKQ